MSAKIRSIGIVRLEPSSFDRLGETCDDSTLDLLLAGLAHCHNLTNATISRRRSVQFTTARRLNWPAPSGVNSTLQANVDQLIDDLQAEFERAQSAGL